jgi:DNA-binding GntR family transcriptional regulator
MIAGDMHAADLATGAAGPLVLGDLGGDARSRTLADRAFAAVHEAILVGRLEPGRRLPIEELAGALEMSPMPVREALRRLDAVGLVEHVPHRGARVTELSVADLVEIYEARLALEPLAVRHAAERLGEEDAERARAAFAALAKVVRRPGPRTWPIHTEFHFTLYRATGSRWLLRLITPLWESAERYRMAAWPKGRLDVRQIEHQAILDAVVDHQPARAADLMHDHLATTANELAARMGHQAVFEMRLGPRPVNE